MIVIKHVLEKVPYLFNLVHISSYLGLLASVKLRHLPIICRGNVERLQLVETKGGNQNKSQQGFQIRDKYQPDYLQNRANL